jgi:hypothetical protein
MNYLIANPGAKDTLDGIEGWWLRSGGAAPPCDLLRQAVDALLEAGWMSVSNSGDARVVYGVSDIGLNAGISYLDGLQRES